MQKNKNNAGANCCGRHAHTQPFNHVLTWRLGHQCLIIRLPDISVLEQANFEWHNWTQTAYPGQYVHSKTIHPSCVNHDP
jgi:hypothetical protein